MDLYTIKLEAAKLLLNKYLPNQIDVNSFVARIKGYGGTTSELLCQFTWEDLEDCGLSRLMARKVSEVFRADETSLKQILLKGNLNMQDQNNQNQTSPSPNPAPAPTQGHKGQGKGKGQGQGCQGKGQGKGQGCQGKGQGRGKGCCGRQRQHNRNRNRNCGGGNCQNP